MPAETSRRLPRSFWPLNISQCLGAMNDNAFRWVMAWALVTRASTAGAEGVNETALFISGVVFAVPFILFSSSAGVLADRFSKRRLIIVVNTAEALVMALGLLAFLSDSPLFLYTVLFLMAAQSAVFGPSKFGILPEIVPPDRLSYANGLMGGFTYLAIIFGTVGGALLFHAFGAKDEGAAMTPAWRASVVCIFFALTGLTASFFIRDTGVRASGKHLSPWFWKDVARNLRLARPDRYLFLTLFAVAFFLFLGSFVQLNVAAFGVNVMGLDKAAATNLFLATAFGMGAGSYLAGRLSGRTVEIGLVPVGAILVSTTLMLLVLPITSTALVVAILFVLGVGGGFYIVPLNTFLQQHAPRKHRGELIATSSFLSFCGVGLASVLLLVMESLGFGPAQRFFLFGILTLGLSIWVVRVLPDFLIRFVGLIITRIVYRLETHGAENIPIDGGALLVCNHVSYADAALLTSTMQRRIRFVMDRHIYESRRFNWLFRLMQALPVSRADKPREIVRSLQEARDAIDQGYLVCIFAEGSLSRTGYIMEFKRGFERIVKDSMHPVIPVNIHGMWGSVLTFGEEQASGGLPRPFRRRVQVSFGAPMPPETSAFDIRQAVLELSAEAFERDRATSRPLPVEFARVARARWLRPCIADSTGRELTFGRTLTASLALAELLENETGDDRRIGLMLPTSVAGALANLAVAFLGRVPVNLNYTASGDALRSAIEQADIRHVVTSRAFVEKIKLDPAQLPGVVFMEDLMGRVDRSLKIRSFLRARFLPARRLLRGPTPDVDDTATIIFSSGTTGTPKGVELTHFNIISNATACTQVFRVRPDTSFCGILPFFHSFGFMGTLWLPLLGGVPVVYHYNPLEAETVGRIVEEHRCTVLIATPTFLLNYVRKVEPEQFATLRIVITGAEKLKDRVARAFQERFDITPMEGYGTTELSPVSAVNLPNVNIANVVQEAYKPGTIGRPIPGVAMKVVDPDNLDRELGHGEEGMLLVKGPNVMRGYLGRPDLTEEAIRSGWYVTGDIARIDHDGFVTITDRLSRFSKIGGEMVPHVAIEEALQEGLGATEQVCAVTSLPDEKKGEKLVLLLKPEAGEPREALRLLRERNLPNLWIPSPANTVMVDDLPVLGSGKLDLKGLKQLARERLGDAPTEEAKTET